MKILLSEEQYNNLLNEGHVFKEMKKLLHWAEKVEGCFLKDVKNGVMICPPTEVRQPCYTTHRSDTGVQDVLSAIGKWNGVKKKVADEAYKLNISVAQLKIILNSSNKGTLNEQGSSTLTVPEQTLLGFLNRFLKGEPGEFENTPIDQLKKNMMFNEKTIYPMVQKLLEKKKTGKKTYDDKVFNSLFLTMDKVISKEQRYEFFKDAENITNVTYSSQH